MCMRLPVVMVVANVVLKIVRGDNDFLLFREKERERDVRRSHRAKGFSLPWLEPLVSIKAGLCKEPFFCPIVH